jgi:hypothetical protein
LKIENLHTGVNFLFGLQCDMVPKYAP